MSSDPKLPPKVFTVEEANATLPLVRAIATDLANLARDISERRDRLAFLMADRDIEEGDPYGDELNQMREELEKDEDRLREYIVELQELGVVPNGLEEGLVDFPSMMDGRLVFLCWKLGEPEVLHWHEIDAGFTGRQPLTAGSVADDGFESTT